VAALRDVSGCYDVPPVGVEGEEMTQHILGTVTKVIDGDTVDVEQKAVELPELGWISNAHVIRVIDGDTVELAVTRKVRVRLRNCWAPELEPIEQRRKWAVLKDIPEASGMASHLHLKELAEGYQVRVFVAGSPDDEFSDVTSMGRLVGDVYLLKDNTNLAAAQVAAGHATKERPK
jgi:endonuclease YncB( thermonuclease family)